METYILASELNQFIGDKFYHIVDHHVDYDRSRLYGSYKGKKYFFNKFYYKDTIYDIIVVPVYMDRGGCFFNYRKIVGIIMPIEPYKNTRLLLVNNEHNKDFYKLKLIV